MTSQVVQETWLNKRVVRAAGCGVNPNVVCLIACVAGVKRGRGMGNLGARGKKERLQGRHCFLHFSRSDSERENSDWSELIKCQSST